MEWMPHRKRKETKQPPGTAWPGNILGCCLVSLRFVCNIHSVQPYLVDVRQTGCRVLEGPGGVFLCVVVERLVHRDDGSVQRRLVHRHLARQDPADLGRENSNLSSISLIPIPILGNIPGISDITLYISDLMASQLLAILQYLLILPPSMQ